MSKISIFLFVVAELYSEYIFRAGDEVTISYVPLVFGEPQKSLHIQSEWNFNCICSRCTKQDKMSQINCLECHKGYFEYPSGQVLSSSWHCNSCDKEMEVKEILAMIGTAERQLK